MTERMWMILLSHFAVMSIIMGAVLLLNSIKSKQPTGMKDDSSKKLE